MGRRRRKRMRRQVRSVPQVYKRYFTCPRCGSLTLSITLTQAKDEEGNVKSGVKRAVAVCGNCGLRCEMEVPEGLEKVDVYNLVSDAYFEGRGCGEVGGEEASGEAPGEEEV
ncbi:Zn ribbon-containing protein [Aeropyrum camini]|uniref:Uncharacterized Zn ribbon-containing protein n=1 Tax=Aeropyrum camini SY1 = JCM 12091 TaxID=1198449 RepID=U3TD91_9CREN|nr:Zn ribbon-containing protein [Aeropyrum camini]BAN89943.1 uncharacterized Zn ribbon-containing protein [Aeropyrum camini SY1 = JCM 12091]